MPTWVMGGWCVCGCVVCKKPFGTALIIKTDTSKGAGGRAAWRRASTYVFGRLVLGAAARIGSSRVLGHRGCEARLIKTAERRDETTGSLAGPCEVEPLRVSVVSMCVLSNLPPSAKPHGG